ncbi:hypothetical protein OIE63_06895 [Streptomyces sp. NBC_01795]|uniref:hypothetical protein n=1 Tax=unclassified Streptomyces TaxID=2593676 RepID=UPI002DD98605|nr:MULTISPECIES: hypothetical protein [unclassified Streptomyces]WSA91306.1 hypothetical protein OIE63_06895 [Streptomyces sp. NBC_01795]WSB75630.1 hypothetical protein OHB04_07420 [Streptomyces sp. NBC_01775]WSS16085.1 hypothetical protein OG533_32470 [Streptomyces sp. NBC_01186]
MRRSLFRPVATGILALSVLGAGASSGVASDHSPMPSRGHQGAPAQQDPAAGVYGDEAAAPDPDRQQTRPVQQTRPAQQQMAPGDPRGDGPPWWGEGHHKRNEAHANKKVVRKWEEFRVYGKATGIPRKSVAFLQQKQRGKWATLRIRVPVNHNGTYTMRVRLALKGNNELRTIAGGVPSRSFHVFVR